MGLRKVTYRLYEWWYPPSDHVHPYPNYSYRGYGGETRRSRPARAWRRLKRSFRHFFSAVRHSAISNSIYNWWYPPSDHSQSYPNVSYRGYGGNVRKSRPVRAWHHLRRRLKNSALGRGYSAFLERLYEWWYPPSDHDPGSYPNVSYRGYGGYGGQVRRSRPARAWHRLKRGLRHSALGRGYRTFSEKWIDWYYPLSEHEGGYPNQRRVSRPVRLLRRSDRWFRRTWLGRKLSWLLNDLADFSSHLSDQISEDFAWWRVKRWLFRWQTAVWLVCLSAVAWSGYCYGLPRLRLYREQQYAQQALRMLAKGDFKRAMLRAQQVLSLNYSNAIATRVFADLADGFGSPHALYWRQRTLMLMPDATNQIALASTALRVEEFPFPTAVKTLNAIEAAFQQTANYHRVAGALALKLAKLTEAEQHYAEALRLDPASPANRMSLAVVRLQSKNPKLITDSRTTLELLRTDRQLGLVATRSLVAESIDRGEFERAEYLSHQVLTNAQSSFSDRILHLAILNARHSTNFALFLAETEQRAKANAFHCGELAAWMNSSGHAQQALDWLESMPPQSTRQGLLPIAIADSYVALGKWKELQAYLERSPWTGLEHIRFAMMALAGTKQSGDMRYSLGWQSAIRFASGSPAALNMLAKLFAAWGWKERTEDVLWHAAQKYPEQPWPLTSLNILYANQRDTVGMRRVAQAAFQRNPKDSLACNNYVMLSLLTGADVTKAHEHAAQLHATAPKNPVFASTYAFSLYVQGRAKDAVQTLRDLRLDQLDDPSLAAYYGIFLAAAGDKQTAQTYLAKSAKAFLLPEELVMVERARKAM